MLSIRMLKLCGKSICEPLDLIFQSSIKHGEFPTEWKKPNVVPVCFSYILVILFIGGEGGGSPF